MDLRCPISSLHSFSLFFWVIIHNETIWEHFLESGTAKLHCGVLIFFYEALRESNIENGSHE